MCEHVVYLQDLAILTGGEVISEDLGHKLEKVELGQLGSVKKVTVTKDDTIMLHGGGACDGDDNNCVAAV